MVKDPPLLWRCAQLLEQYPGYTVSSLLDEDAEVFEGLWAMLFAESAVRGKQAKQAEMRANRGR